MNFPILQTLHEEHLTTLGLLDRFDRALKKIGPNGPPEEGDSDMALLLADVVANMKDEAECHFNFEEENLFPRFSKFGDPGIPNMLRAEHDAIRPLARSLVKLGSAAKAEGFTGESWREFHQIGRELIERETFHVQKEEMGFLPALDQMLSADDAAQLSEIYEASKTGS
ncbi:MAG: hemerythrin domain-containing protein [Alphaproteobacteria bacterium]|nr:hemerythrin domain-containing protein [Alphaproteobacteria bacterium]